MLYISMLYFYICYISLLYAYHVFFMEAYICNFASINLTSASDKMTDSYYPILCFETSLIKIHIMNPKIYKRFLMFLMVFMTLFPISVMAQQNTVTGTVTDSDGEPLIGASVIVKGTATGTATDLDGNFTVKAGPLATLQISYLGYKTKDVALEGRTNVNVVLEENTDMLDEVVVVGYGQMKKSDLTGAVGSLGGGEIRETPVNNLGSAIQGKIAGVQIIDAAKPGDNVNIKIRGLGSINQCDPLVVIDGVPTDMGLNNINMQDVERLDVLKDASATAIYGSRGANGVVMITTRRGATGTAKVSVSANMAVQSASKKLSLLNSSGYAALNNDMMTASGRNTNPEWADPSSLTLSTNWVDELLHTGIMQNYNINFSGGNENAHYYLSAGFLDQTGIVKGVGYRRFTFQTNNDARMKPWLKISNNLLFSADYKHSGSYSMTDAMHALPVFPVRDENGEWSGPSGNADWYGGVRNPVGSNEMYKNSTKGFNLLANIAADITIVPDWLQFRSLFGYDAKAWYDEAFSPAYDWKPIPVEESSNYNSSYKSFTYLWDNYFTFDHTFGGKHAVNVMAGMSAQWNDYSYLNATMNGFLFDNVHQMDNGETMKDIGGNRSQWSLLSYMARANYSYDNKYLLTLTLRHDGSSRFGSKHRWGTFPSASAAWRISGEDFFPQDKAVSDLKLRLGYGRTGSQASVDNYGYLPTLSTLVYPFGDPKENQSVLVAQTLANPYIHWETVEQYNAGIDISLLNSRLTFSLDGYIKNTRDMLVKASIPITSGFEDTSTTYTNAGKVRNIGWELSANSVNLTGEFGWETNLVVTYNKNKIKDLNSEVPFYINQLNNSYVTMLCAGYPINVFYGYVTDGIFQTLEEVSAHAVQPGAEPGDIRFRDLNNDGVINDADRTVIGNPNPSWLFSMNNVFNWKGFELQIYLQGVAGNKIYNYTRIGLESMSTAYNQLASTANRWTGAGTSDCMPRAVWADPNQNARVSDRWIEDGSYLRLKNISLSYNFPTKWMRSIGLESLKLTFSCENVATATRYKGIDPEVGLNGIDMSNFPSARTFNFGLNVNF